MEALGQISNNYALFSEPDVDQRIDDILALPIEDQADAWGELDEYISETYLPLIPLTYDGVIQVHGSNVNGHFDDLVLGMPTFKNIWLTQGGPDEPPRRGRDSGPFHRGPAPTPPSSTRPAPSRPSRDRTTRNVTLALRDRESAHTPSD